MKKKAIIWLLSAALLVSASALIFLLPPPVLELCGESCIVLEYGSEYVEEGAVARSPLIGRDLEISISGSVDTLTAGKYEILYEAGFLHHKLSASRLVTVLEAPPPPEPEKPKSCIELSGGDRLDWPCGIPFEEPGFVAYDSEGKDCTELVLSEGDVVCWKLGEYEVCYSFTDKSGDTVRAVRTVSISPVELPPIEETENVIYLTFDDGPSEYTELVLELLDKYNAKATFFVIAAEDEYIHLLEDIHERGHSLGIHCAEHNFLKIYTNELSFFTDFLEAQRIIYKYTGTYANLSRFPGGSPTARTYLETRSVEAFPNVCKILGDMGVRYFDWNVQPEDSRGWSAEMTFSQFKEMVPEYPVPISLQHDTRNYSVGALENMLKWGTENGYEFRGLELSSPPARKK